jgi:hypothetical protein
MVKSSCLTYWTDPHDPIVSMRITINPIVSSWEAAAKPEMSALYTGWLRTGFPLFVGYPEIININQPSFLSCIHLSQFLSQYFPASKKKIWKLSMSKIIRSQLSISAQWHRSCPSSCEAAVSRAVPLKGRLDFLHPTADDPMVTGGSYDHQAE